MTGGGLPSGLQLLIIAGAAIGFYNLGFNAQQLFPLVLDSNDALAPGEMSGACAARLREAQIGFFSSHACWFNTSSSGDWTAAKMFMEVRRQARSKWDDKCAFMTLGLPLSSGPNKVENNNAGDNDDMQFALNVDEWQNEMSAIGAFDDCATFTYEDESKLRILEKAVEGQRNAYARPLWQDNEPTSLDIEFEKVTQAVIEGTVFVWITDPHRSPVIFKKFHGGLSSKRVAGIIWHRTMASAAAQRALKDEVEYISSFGFAVYLASATSEEMGQEYKRVARPSAFMRIDGVMWDSVYTVMNLDLTLSLVAIRMEHPYRIYLDDARSLCPERKMKSGFGTHPGQSWRPGERVCECHFEEFTTTMVDHTCSLAGLMNAAGVIRDAGLGGEGK